MRAAVEPFGTWRATKTEVSRYDVAALELERRFDHLRRRRGVRIRRSIPGSSSRTAEPGKVDVSEPDVVVLFENSCLEGAGASCEYFDDECEPLDCGLCRCSFSRSSLAQ